MRNGNRRFAGGRLEHLEHRVLLTGKDGNDLTGGYLAGVALVPAEVATFQGGVAFNQGLGGGISASALLINYGNPNAVEVATARAAGDSTAGSLDCDHPIEVFSLNF